ncbi:MAG TPA: glycoside hydrolase [Caldilineae bacterium]|nr:glycoside hydrolase [Caldilineae bacterium]
MLHVAIIWHMHQPYYRQPGSDIALLPWTRLHATKDYLHMAQVVERFPDVHVTFTLVPSLAEQLQDYASGALQDRLMLLARQAYFSPDDKRYLLNICYSISWDNIIRRYPPYAALLDRRHLALLNPDYFSEQTYRDLIIWFNLAWIDPNLLETDELLRDLVAKGKDYTLKDVEALTQRQLQIVGEVAPTYRHLQDQGQIEVITVPYYHPILPLLVDSRIAQRPSPGLQTPDPPFRAPDDAQAQIERGVAHYHALLGRTPRGMWPSEGAVSPEMASMVAAQGIGWMATDEAILGKSLGVFFERDGNDFLHRPDLLYQPYRLATPQGDISFVFRDHNLSDRVGFTYQRLGGEQAAEDMIVRLKRIAYQLRHRQTPALVSIILDGENAWETYEHNGDIFLNALYRRLQEDPELRAVTVSEHLQAYPPEDELADLASGSWIRGDFTTWIGDPEHSEAWRRLRDLRNAYEKWLDTGPAAERVDEVQRYLFTAEGSDWFWWYSHHNASDQDALFDQLFLDNLAAAYRGMGQAPPLDDLVPIQGIAHRLLLPLVAISPRLTAETDPSAQWAQARVLRPVASIGAMQQAGGDIQALRYGNDVNYLYLRLELNSPVDEHHVEVSIHTGAGEFLLSRGRGQTTTFLYHLVNGSHISLGPTTCNVSGALLETAIPLARLGLSAAAPGEKLGLVVRLDPNSPQAEQLPATGQHVIELAAGSPG